MVGDVNQIRWCAVRHPNDLLRAWCVLEAGHDGDHYSREPRAKWSNEESDPVTAPAHYTTDPSGVECIEITRHRTFNIGNAIKYLWRAGIKDTETHVEDLRKAAFYIADEIARLERVR